MNAFILTLSDKGARGERTDQSGPALCEWLQEKGVTVDRSAMIPDEIGLIIDLLEEWGAVHKPDLILTTGGTGVSPRDVTPDATRKVIERELPGFSERMRIESFKKTPHAIISRAVVGIKGETLIVNLPGSPKGAIQNLESIWPAVPHTVSKIKGDQSDCAI